MKKIICATFSLVVLFGILCMPVLVGGTETPSAQELIQTLKRQIEQLNAQIAALQTQLSSIRQTQQDIKGTLKLIKQLKQGMSGEDVKLLQQVLATDKDIYPEGLITGYFGSLTANAVKRFQKNACLDQVGQVGPKTLSRINEILTAGAGESGKVPPGLLIAPGIRKKLCGIIPQPLPGQTLPPGIENKLETTTPSADGVNSQ